MKPKPRKPLCVKAWATLPIGKAFSAALDLWDLKPTRFTSESRWSGSRVVRVEIREIVKRKAAKK